MTDPTSDPPRYSLEFWRQYCRLTYETFLRSGAPEDQAFNHAVTQALKGFREEGMPSCETMEHQSMADDAIEKMERVVYELRDE